MEQAPETEAVPDQPETEAEKVKDEPDQSAPEVAEQPSETAETEQTQDTGMITAV